MFKVNDNYLKLPGSYLFSTIGKKVNAYSAAHPDKKIIQRAESGGGREDHPSGNRRCDAASGTCYH